MLGYHTPPGVDTPGTEHAGRYGQCAGGMHPTGMQSCYPCFYVCFLVVKVNLTMSIYNSTASGWDISLSYVSYRYRIFYQFVYWFI